MKTLGLPIVSFALFTYVMHALPFFVFGAFYVVCDNRKGVQPIIAYQRLPKKNKTTNPGIHSIVDDS